MRSNRGFFRLILVASSVLLLWAANAIGQESLPSVAGKRLASAHPAMVGNLSCSAVACHGRQSPGGLRGSELVRWKQHDPHARAADTLQSPWFNDVLTKASRRADGSADVLETYRQCATCHDPAGLAGEQAGEPITLPRDAETLAMRGVACESCHGNGERWVSQHFERGITSATRTSLGMRNLDDLSTRARLCSACHVGDRNHDLPHDFYAAGHPLLHFELAAYQRLITRKHWNDPQERRAQPELETQLWFAGQIAGIDGSLELLKKRTSGKLAETSWPELAEFDCFGCHQPLRANAEVSNGLPRFRDWSYAAFDRLVRRTAAEKHWPQLREKFEQPPFFADAGNIAPELAALRAGLQTLVEKYGSPVDPPGSLTERLLTALAERDDRPATWNRLVQRFLAFQALERAGRDEFQFGRQGPFSTASAGEFQRLTAEITTHTEAIRAALAFEKRTEPGGQELILAIPKILLVNQKQELDRLQPAQVSSMLDDLATLLLQRAALGRPSERHSTSLAGDRR